MAVQMMFSVNLLLPGTLSDHNTFPFLFSIKLEKLFPLQGEGAHSLYL